MENDADTSRDANDAAATENTPTNDSDVTPRLPPRTQSFTSIASSQASRASRLPDYDFGDDDRPGNYKGGKKKQKNREKDNKLSDKKKKPEKTTNLKKTKGKKEGKLKEEKKKVAKSFKEKKKPEETKTKKPKKKTKTGEENKKGKQNDEFQNELRDTLNQMNSDNEPANAKEASTSVEPSTAHTAKEKEQTKQKKKKINEKKGRSKSKGRQKSKKKQSFEREDSQASFSDVTADDVTDAATTDGDGESKTQNKKKRKSLGKKKKSKKDGPVVVVVNDDDYDYDIKKRKMFLGLFPIPSKKEPIVYNCCMCCSLGAGSLISGIIFVLFCIGYLVIRAEEFKLRAVGGIWRGHHRLPDVWRVLLVIGFITASLCLLASMLLVIGSCLWGSKERYKRIRRVIIFWFLSASTALINNIGEAVFIQMMPVIKQSAYTASDSIKEIKKNNIRLWAFTGLYTLFFLYVTLILISYLRLLKYMDLPKIGTAPSAQNQERLIPKSTPKIASGSSKRERRPSIRSVQSETQVKTISEGLSRNYGSDRQAPEIPSRTPESQRSNQSIADSEDRIYVNTSFLQYDEPVEPEKKPKSESFKEVLEDLKNTPLTFDNLSKPKPPKRMPLRRHQVPPFREAIYMNHSPRPTTPGVPYAKVSKPLKRTASLSDVKSPVYDCPPSETDLREISEKKKQNNPRQAPYGSGDTGFNSRSSVASSIGSHPEHPEISEMERLAEELRQKQEALDKSGDCDPATAEHLTVMALNALKLSEKILQDVKSNEKSRFTPVPDGDEEKLPVQQNLRLAESFFDELSRDPNALTENPIEEMFRMYGKDLCSQNPEMVDRYLMSYKALQQNKSRHRQFLPETGIADVAMNEQKPWMSILNPSEAVPAVQSMPPTPVNPPISSISQSAMSGYQGEDLGQSAFAPSLPTITQPFHSVSHAQTGPPPPNSLFPIDYPQQNSASYNAEPSQLGAPSTQIIPFHGPPSYDQSHKWSHQVYPPTGVSKGGFPYRRVPFDSDYYYDDECPYSCCYSQYDGYGSIYGDYVGPDSMYDENGMYTGPNWFPMGDPAYSIDPYYNPYEIWSEPAPPYTEESTSTAQRTRPSSRGYDSKFGSSSRGYDSKTGSSSRYTDGSRGYSRRSSSRTSRGYTYKSRSLPDLLDDDLYSENLSLQRRSSKSIQNLAKWGIDNDDFRDSIGRPSSRRTKSRSSYGASSALQETTRDAFMKGYRAALKEALTTIEDKKGQKNSMKRSSVSDGEELIGKLISEVGERQRSRSPDRPPSSSKASKITRTPSFDSRTTNGSRRFSREERRSFRNSGNESRNLSRASSGRRSARNSGRLDGRASVEPEELSSSLSRKASKPTFRPASRPGHPLLSDDYYEDYRSTSSVPPLKENLDDFGLLRRKSSSRNSTGFKGFNSETEMTSDADDILSAFELMSSHGGRPSTRSRLSNRSSQNTKEIVRYFDDGRSNTSYPYSENDNHFYNKLDLERAFPEPEFQRGRSQERPKIGNERSRSQSGSRRRHDSGQEFLGSERSRSVNEGRRSDREILWFMGDDETEPIYSDYGSHWTSDSLPSEMRHRQISRSSSFPDQPRPGSAESSKRKSVTFDKRPKIKEVS